MVDTYFTDHPLESTKYSIMNYNTYKYDKDHILITTDTGAWVVLNDREYKLLRTMQLEKNKNLFSILEDKGIIITKRNYNKIIENTRTRLYHLFNGITLHIVVPTLRCNLKCVYCQAKSRPLDMKEYDMSEDTARKVVDFIFQSPSKYYTIEFQGGEPTANFDIVKFIVEYAKEKNGSNSPSDGWFFGEKSISFRIVTNLTLMDDEKFDFIKKNQMEVNTSLDGPKFLHNKNRPSESYDKVVRWIKELKDYRFFSGAIATVTRESLKYPKEIVDEYLSLGLKSIKLRHLNVTGMAAEKWEKIGYTWKEYVDFWKKYMEYLFEVNKEKTIKDVDTSLIAKRILFLKPPLNTCIGAPCGAGITQAAYDQNGNIFICDESRGNDTFKIGDVTQSYKDVFTSNDVLQFIGNSSMAATLADASPWHPYVSPCLVSTYGQTGTLIPKLPTDFVWKIRTEQAKYIFEKIIYDKEKRDILFKWAGAQ